MGNSNHTYFSHFSAVTQRLDSESAAAWEVHDQAIARQLQGEDIVILSIGDPDFRTPDPIIDNAVSHMRVGRTHYSPALGEISLRRAVADYETRVSYHPCQMEDVAIFPGVTSALYSVLSCLLDAKDEIVMVDPTYVGYQPIINGLDLTAKMVITHASKSFEPQIDDLIVACSEQTRVILLNTPSNPAGSIIRKSTLQDIAQYCYEHNIWLVCDEIYSMFTYESRHVSLRNAADHLDNIVIIDGLSKSHAMSGWRVGWVVAPAQLIQHLGKFSAMSIFGCPQFIQDAATFALNNDEYYVADMCNTYRARRDKVCQCLDEIEELSYIRPESGMFVMIDISRINADDVQFAQRLLDSEKVSVLPGSAFGQSTQGHVRMSLVQPENILLEGCNRMKRFISNLELA